VSEWGMEEYGRDRERPAPPLAGNPVPMRRLLRSTPTGAATNSPRSPPPPAPLPRQRRPPCAPYSSHAAPGTPRPLCPPQTFPPRRLPLWPSLFPSLRGQDWIPLSCRLLPSGSLPSPTPPLAASTAPLRKFVLSAPPLSTPRPLSLGSGGRGALSLPEPQPSTTPPYVPPTTVRSRIAGRAGTPYQGASGRGQTAGSLSDGLRRAADPSGSYRRETWG